MVGNLGGKGESMKKFVLLRIRLKTILSELERYQHRDDIPAVIRPKFKEAAEALESALKELEKFR